MSKVAIKGASTGTATFTIESPATNTNRTLVLPDAAGNIVTDSATQTLTNKSIVATQLTGTIAAARLPAGSVLQVVSTTKTDTFSTASATYVDITGLQLSITPTSATSKILVSAYVPISNSLNQGVFIVIDRNGTIVTQGDADGSRMQAAAMGTGSGNSLGYIINSPNIFFLDSPASTSALTYKVQINRGGSGTAFVNRTGTDANNTSYGRVISTITAMEIAA
jgi:hypothetical protein